MPSENWKEESARINEIVDSFAVSWRQSAEKAAVQMFSIGWVGPALVRLEPKPSLMSSEHETARVNKDQLCKGVKAKGQQNSQTMSLDHKLQAT